MSIAKLNCTKINPRAAPLPVSRHQRNAKLNIAGKPTTTTRTSIFTTLPKFVAARKSTSPVLETTIIAPKNSQSNLFEELPRLSQLTKSTPSWIKEHKANTIVRQARNSNGYLLTPTTTPNLMITRGLTSMTLTPPAMSRSKDAKTTSSIAKFPLSKTATIVIPRLSQPIASASPERKDIIMVTITPNTNSSCTSLAPLAVTTTISISKTSSNSNSSASLTSTLSKLMISKASTLTPSSATTVKKAQPKTFTRSSQSTSTTPCAKKNHMSTIKPAIHSNRNSLTPMPNKTTTTPNLVISRESSSLKLTKKSIVPTKPKTHTLRNSNTSASITTLMKRNSETKTTTGTLKRLSHSAASTPRFKKTTLKSKPVTSKSMVQNTKCKTPFKSFITSGLGMRNRAKSADFAYDLSNDEQLFMGNFKTPMKAVPVGEREILESGQRGAYLAMRHEQSPDRKYNFPEATSWRIGWLHNCQTKQRS